MQWNRWNPGLICETNERKSVLCFRLCRHMERAYCWFAALTFQQHASVSQGRICSDNCTCCHTEKLQIKLALTQSQYTDTGAVPALTLERQAPGRVATGVPPPPFFFFFIDMSNMWINVMSRVRPSGHW